MTRAWSRSEELMLIEHYGDTAADLAMLLSRSVLDIREKRRTLGLPSDKENTTQRREAEQHEEGHHGRHR
jgi:hypothetical protein